MNDPAGFNYIQDSACYCERCVSRTKERYALEATCMNCGTKFVVVSRKGDKRSSNPDCPACGVGSWPVYGDLVPVPES
jgi:DNA-directed RNA polymerase subunit RPC12/RpoP